MRDLYNIIQDTKSKLDNDYSTKDIHLTFIGGACEIIFKHFLLFTVFDNGKLKLNKKNEINFGEINHDDYKIIQDILKDKNSIKEYLIPIIKEFFETKEKLTKKKIVFGRVKSIAQKRYNSNKCIYCQREIENVEEKNMTINLTDKEYKQKSIVCPVCDNCRKYVLSLIAMEVE